MGPSADVSPRKARKVFEVPLPVQVDHAPAPRWKRSRLNSGQGQDGSTVNAVQPFSSKWCWMNPRGDALNLLAQVQGFDFSRFQFLFFAGHLLRRGHLPPGQVPGGTDAWEFTPMVAGNSPIWCAHAHLDRHMAHQVRVIYHHHHHQPFQLKVITQSHFHWNPIKRLPCGNAVALPASGVTGCEMPWRDDRLSVTVALAAALLAGRRGELQQNATLQETHDNTPAEEKDLHETPRTQEASEDTPRGAWAATVGRSPVVRDLWCSATVAFLLQKTLLLKKKT